MNEQLQRIIDRINEVLADECHLDNAPAHYNFEEAHAWINGKETGLEKALEIIKEEAGK